MYFMYIDTGYVALFPAVREKQNKRTFQWLWKLGRLNTHKGFQQDASLYSPSEK